MEFVACFVYNTPRLLCNTQIETLKDWTWYESRGRDAQGQQQVHGNCQIENEYVYSQWSFKEEWTAKDDVNLCVYELKVSEKTVRNRYLFLVTICLFHMEERRMSAKKRPKQDRSFQCLGNVTQERELLFPCFCESENRVQTPFRPLFT